MVRTSKWPVYWVEDELDLFTHTIGRLEACGCKVKKIKNASRALKRLELLRLRPGPIIVDLLLPDDTAPYIPATLEGPQLGLWLINELRKELGPDQEFFVVSGNLTLDSIQELRKSGVADRHIFPKPLNYRTEEFVKAILKTLGARVSPDK